MKTSEVMLHCILAVTLKGLDESTCITVELFEDGIDLINTANSKYIVSDSV